MGRRLAIILIVVLLVNMSCTLSLPFSPTKAPEVDLVATWVAGTLAANPVQVMETPANPPQGEIIPSAAPPTVQATLASPAVDATPLATNLQETLDNPPPSGFDPGLLRVAYAVGGQLRLWTEGVGEVVLHQGEPVADVLLSEDGWVIVFTTRDADYLFTGLWRVNADGSDLRRLLDAPALFSLSSTPSADGVAPYQMSFVPGSRSLAFNTRLVYMGPGLVIQDDLRLVSTSSGELQTVVEAGQGGTFTYSPDGAQVALVSPTSVSLIDADGNNRRSNLVTYPMIMTYSEYQYYPQVTWEQDGSAFWVVVPSEDSLAPDASMAFWRVPVTGGDPALRATYPFDLSLFFAGQVISPDLQKTVYLSRTAPDANQWTLHVARLDGSADFPIRSGNLRFETWSPDSNWMTIEQDGELLIGDPSGSFQSLAAEMSAVEIQWVDADRFLFLSGDYEAMQLNLGSLSVPSQAIGPMVDSYIPFSFSVGGG